MKCSWLRFTIVVLALSPAALTLPANNVVEVLCNSSNDCKLPYLCVGAECIDPCEGICGLNTVCEVQDQTAICACKSGYNGDPFKECRPRGDGECLGNADCPVDMACVSRRCVDPCQDTCGLNTNCKVVNHRPLCACLDGFAYDSSAGCVSLSTPKCLTNSHCGKDLACRRQQCVDPCDERMCGNNTSCLVNNHYPVCSCKPGFVGDARHECVPLYHTSDGDVKENRKKFLIILDEKSWHDAFDDCQCRGMKLATINSEEENEDIRNQILESTKIDFWIGGHDLGRYQSFIWASTGERLSYTNWGEGEPTGESYSCMWYLKDSGTWKSQSCDNSYAYICM